MVCPSERLAGATRRGHTMAPEGQRPSQWRCLTKLPREMYAQPIVHKALSRGIIRKSACILAEITIWKSQELTLVGDSLCPRPVCVGLIPSWRLGECARAVLDQQPI